MGSQGSQVSARADSVEIEEPVSGSATIRPREKYTLGIPYPGRTKRVERGQSEWCRSLRPLEALLFCILSTRPGPFRGELGRSASAEPFRRPCCIRGRTHSRKNLWPCRCA